MGWMRGRGCAACSACSLPRGRVVQDLQSGAVYQGQAGDGHHLSGLHLSLQALLSHQPVLHPSQISHSREDTFPQQWWGTVPRYSDRGQCQP